MFNVFKKSGGIACVVITPAMFLFVMEAITAPIYAFKSAFCAVNYVMLLHDSSKVIV